MKRKIVIPNRPFLSCDVSKPPRERRTLGLRFDLVTGESVSGLR